MVMKIKYNSFILTVLLVSLVSACGGKKNNAIADSEIQKDITRPPVFVKSTDLSNETNPEETISAEEWQKQQNQAE